MLQPPWSWLLWAALIPALAVLNRFRGGGYGAAVLPGHPRWYVWPLWSAAGWLVGYPWWLLGPAYLVWSNIPWGRWFRLGRSPRSLTGREPRAIERVVEGIAGASDHVALFLIHALALVPVALACSALLNWGWPDPWAALAGVGVAALVVLTYELAWRFAPPNSAISTAEHGVGALFGSAMIAGCFLI